jgi:hypothetical protein
LRFEVNNEVVELSPEVVVVGGFTGRDVEEMQRHIAELGEEGISAPDETPAFYLLPPAVLTQGMRLDVLHGHTSGEAEIALLFEGDDAFVTLASDHTDRRAEALDIHLSKQVCSKPFATTAWALEDVVNHWDALELRSWIEESGTRTVYQKGTAADILPPESILARLHSQYRLGNFALLSGTIPVSGGIRGSGRFWAELSDPVRERSIQLDYVIREPDVRKA